MRVLFLGRKQVRWGLLLLVLLIFSAGMAANWELVARRLFGVKSGIRLEGRVVQGLLPEEVAGLVETMASGINREPRNASYFPETGEIVPSQSGRKVDIAGTVNQVYRAEAGSELKLLITPIPPSVTEDFFKPVYQGNRESNRVGLAINVAWGEEHLDTILKTLDEENVRATFFFVGTWVKLFPELVKNIGTRGHEIANHGLYHGHPVQMNREQLKKLIADNALLLWSVTGRKSANLFAPPYGELNSEILAVAGELGYYTVLWSVDTIDWKNPAPDAMLQRVLSKIESGGIILMHPTIATRTALRGLIRGLRQKGLEPGMVSRVMTKS